MESLSPKLLSMRVDKVRVSHDHCRIFLLRSWNAWLEEVGVG